MVILEKIRYNAQKCLYLIPTSQDNFYLKINEHNFLDLSNLEDQLNRSVDENSRLKKSVERARDDGRRNREKIAVDFEHTENRLNHSLRENDGTQK